jgi:hypothetical protein
VIAHEIVTGRRPFVAEDALQLSVLQRSGVRVKPSALRPGISSAAEKLILQSISYNPNDRPQSANGFGDALSQALLNSQTTPTIQMEAVHAKRVRLGWIAGALAVVLVAAGGAAWIYRGQQKPAKAVTAAPAGTTAPVSSVVPKTDSEDEAVELAFWNSIGASSDSRLYREYLAKYPNGRFASLAKLKLDGPPTRAAQSAPAAHLVSPAAQPMKASAASLRPALKPDEYGGPLRGELRWTGSLSAGATLAIQGGKAISGDLAGDLPRVPSTVESLTSGVSVLEEPSAGNQWDRVVVKNATTAPVDSIKIRWRVAR